MADCHLAELLTANDNNGQRHNGIRVNTTALISTSSRRNIPAADVNLDPESLVDQLAMINGRRRDDPRFDSLELASSARQNKQITRRLWARVHLPKQICPPKEARAHN